MENKELNKWNIIKDQSINQINYYNELSIKEKRRFEDPLAWRNTEEMSCVMKMADLF